MAKKKKRGPLGPVTVGSGITQYTRQPILSDQPYRDKINRGALVDSRVRRSADQSFNSLRWDCEKFCKDIFESEGLPNPFSFIHINGKQKPKEGHMVTYGGTVEIDRVYHLGYRLVADMLRPPSEDHTALCYAARMAIIIIRIDIFVANAAVSGEPLTLNIDFGAYFGAGLSRLATEMRFKRDNEANVISGKKHRENTKRAREAAAFENRAKRLKILTEINRLIDEGKTKSNAFGLAAQSGFGTSKGANSQLFYRHQKKL